MIDIMKITTEIFYHYCPAMLNPSKDLAERISSFIEQGREKCRTLAGDELFELLDAVEFSIKAVPNDMNSRAADAMMRLACITAICAALPSLDLVYTPTGFGVVSNQNLSPASSERVNRLRSDLVTQGWDAFDSFLDILRHFEEWRKTPIAPTYFKSLFWRGEDMKLFGMANPHRSDLNNALPKIFDAENVLKSFISKAQFDVFCRDILECADNRYHKIAIDYCRLFVVEYSEHGAATAAKAALLQFMEENEVEFPEYMNSREYEANHYKGYENKRRDTSFFFSGF